jgi:hypothetical protein
MAEVRIADRVEVAAAVGAVWAAIRDPAAHARWHPFVTEIDGEHRLGTERACRVEVGRRAGKTRERCIAEEAERRLAWTIEEDSSGFLRFATDWTAGFELQPIGAERTRVSAVSVFRPRSVLVRPMLPMVRRKFHATQLAILAGLKDAVERGSHARIAV